MLKKLALLYLKQNRADRALVSYRRLEQLLPREWETLKAIGHCQMVMGNKADAIATWKQLLTGGMLQPTLVQNIADVMIEHNLNQEALDLFHESRARFGNPNMFAEERATVLKQLGRHDEAREEYLLALAFGSYKPEIFDALNRLSEGRIDDLEARLRTWIAKSEALPLRQALLELLMRLDDERRIASILEIDPQFGNSFTTFLVERVREAALTRPSQFVRRLAVALLRKLSQSTNAYNLCLALLRLPDTTPAQAVEAIDLAGKLTSLEPTPDVDLRHRIRLEMARLALDILRNPMCAQALLHQILPASAPVGLAPTNNPELEIDARLLQQRLLVMRGRFKEAEAWLDSVSSETLPFVGLDPARFLHARAELEAHRGRFQESLDALRRIIEDHPDSMQVNDALALALLLTNGSMGTLEPLQRYLAAQRLMMCGETASATTELSALVATFTESPVRPDAEALLLTLVYERLVADLPPLDATAAQAATQAGGTTGSASLASLATPNTTTTSGTAAIPAWLAESLPPVAPASSAQLPIQVLPASAAIAPASSGSAVRTGSTRPLRVIPPPPLTPSQTAAVRAVIARIEATLPRFRLAPQGARLLVLELDLLRRLPDTATEQQTLMKQFIERYPGNQLARRIAQELERM